MTVAVDGVAVFVVVGLPTQPVGRIAARQVALDLGLRPVVQALGQGLFRALHAGVPVLGLDPAGEFVLRGPVQVA